jgi:hypothetical protein
MTKYHMAFQKVENTNRPTDDNSDDEAPPTDSSIYERDNGTRIDSMENRYPPTPDHTHEEESDSTFFNTALKSVLFAILVALICSIASLQNEVDKLSTYQKEHMQIVSTLISEIEKMKMVEWRMVPANL